MALVYRLFLLPNGDGTYRRVHVPFDDNSEQYRQLFGRSADGDRTGKQDLAADTRLMVAAGKPTIH
jgi:hypothetical protein